MTLLEQAPALFETEAPRTHRRMPSAVILGVIVAVQIAVMSTLQNSAFQDEALYLYAGKDLIDSWFGGRPVTDAYGTYMSGLPQFYPVIAGFLDRLGGVELARALSSACAAWLSVAVFLVTRAFFTSRTGLLAAAVFAIQAPVEFIGRLATYDAFALALLGSALALATRRRPRAVTTAAIILLCVAAALAKYATAVFVPSALLICVILILRASGPRGLLRQSIVAVVTLLICAFGVVELLGAEPDILAGLSSTTTDRTVGTVSPVLSVLAEAARQLALFAAVAVVGLVLALRGRWDRSTRAASVLMALSLFIAPAYHVLKGELTSLDKHIAFGMLFGAPLVGLVISSLLRTRLLTSLQALAISVAFFLVVFGVNVSAAQKLFTAWPNSDRLVASLHTLVRTDNTRVLAEEMEVPRYYLTGSIASYWQFTGLNYFEYTPTSGSGKGTTLSGPDAYRQAIADGYFSVIVIQYGPSADLAATISRQLASDPDYAEVETLKFTTSSGQSAFHVWRKL